MVYEPTNMTGGAPFCTSDEIKNDDFPLVSKQTGGFATQWETYGDLDGDFLRIEWVNGGFKW